MTEMGRRVRAAAKEADIELEELARQLGMSYSTLNRRLKRENWIPYEREAFLHHVAEICGLAYEYFTTDFCPPSAEVQVLPRRLLAR